MADSTKTPPDQAKPGKPPKPAKTAKARRPAGQRAPLLLETAYTASFGLTTAAGLLTAGLSALARVPAWLIAVRAGLAMLALGLVLWIVNYLLMHGAFEAAVDDLRQTKPAEANPPVTSTQEWKA